MSSDLINALIAAGTSIAVVVLSQFLIHIEYSGAFSITSPAIGNLYSG